MHWTITPNNIKIVIMKKRLLTFTMIFIAVLIVRADDPPLTFTWEGEPLGDTTEIVGLPTAFEIIKYADVTNNTSSAMTIKVAREDIDVVPGTSNAICWAGLCFPPSVDTSTTQLTLDPGATTGEGDEFSGHYYPTNILGTTMVKYTFFDIDNPDLNAQLVVKYVAEYVGLGEGIMADGFVSEIFPNPATNFVSINYTLTPQVNSASVKVINLLGKVVKETRIEMGSNKVRLDVSDLSSGVYFYSVVINEEIYKTKKLVVKN